jgi:hypothetical protein
MKYLKLVRIASFKRKKEIWHESLAKDIYVEEALNVLDDLQTKVILKKASPSKIKKRKLAHKFGLLSMNNTTQSLTVIAP